MIIDKLKEIWTLFQESSTVTKVVVLSTTVVVVRWVTKKRYRLPPGPTPLPLVGNLLELRNDADLMDKLNEWKDKFGPIVTSYMGPQRLIIINDFKSMEEAFVKRGSDFSSRPVFYSLYVMTGGLKDIAAAPYGEVWKYQRKIASQALRQYLTGTQLEERVYETLQPIMDQMRQQQGAFNPHNLISMSVLNVLHGLCFGNTLHSKDPVAVEMLYNFDALSNDIGNGFLEDFIPPLRWWPTKKFKDLLLGSVAKFNQYIGDKLQEHKAAFDSENIKSFSDTIILAQQQALQQDDPQLAAMFTDEHAQFTLIDVFTAGVDTSRQTLDWLILVLVAYPDIQRKMQEEIDAVLGSSIPGREHRSKLVYTEAVLLETMRLFYVVPIGMPHETLCDTTVGGYEIPKKTTVVTNNAAMMRDPAFWPEPLKFKPERFIVTSENGSKKLVAARNEGWAPFSMGHRSCIGESLAKLELVYIIAGLLQKLTFSFAGRREGDKPNMRPVSNGITCLPRPYHVFVTPRKS